jgi:hypothetical protein
MAKGIQRGWPIVLSSLKSLLETGQGIDVFAKPKAASTGSRSWPGPSQRPNVRVLPRRTRGVAVSRRRDFP